ncbi:EamA family transporter [Providencia stuartii]|nr:EamA family transporter [Providencia stuartii]
MQSQRKAELFLVLTTFIAAWGWIFSREAVQGMPIFAFLGSRFLLAAIILAPFLLGETPSYSLATTTEYFDDGGMDGPQPRFMDLCRCYNRLAR